MLDEILLILGVLLMAAGCWFLWWPLALVVVGVVCVWIALPPRLPFVMRSLGDRPRRRRDIS